MKNLFNNKHKFIALIMAPFLAIGGYGLADLYMTNRDDAKFFKLVPKGDCKPLRDACEVEGRGLTLHVRFNEPPQAGRSLPVTITSATRVDDVALSLVSDGKESSAVGAAHDEFRKVWNTLPILPEQGGVQNMTLRLAVSETGRVHLAEIPLIISQ